MKHEVFNRHIEYIRNVSFNTLDERNDNYSNDDAIHNFVVGAEMIGGTPAQAAWGYMAKHLSALRDKVLKNDFTDRADLAEKCQDIINYVAIIYAIGMEEGAGSAGGEGGSGGADAGSMIGRGSIIGGGGGTKKIMGKDWAESIFPVTHRND